MEKIFLKEARLMVKTITKVAVDIVRTAEQNPIHILADYWYGIAENWDLNIWYDEKHKCIRGTIYPVKNGNTNTFAWYRAAKVKLTKGEKKCL